jgi:hypothetical protein
MYDQTTLAKPRRIPMNTTKSHSSSSTIFKRQSSGHIPLLTSTNLPQRSMINTKSKRKTDEYENNSFEYDAPTTNYASVRKQQTQPSTVKRIKTEQPITPVRFLLIFIIILIFEIIEKENVNRRWIITISYINCSRNETLGK